MKVIKTSQFGLAGGDHALMYERDKYDFSSGEAKFKSMSKSQLEHTLSDIKKTVEIGEKAARDGESYPRLGYYNDELHTILKEINERKSSGQWETDNEDSVTYDTSQSWAKQYIETN